MNKKAAYLDKYRGPERLNIYVVCNFTIKIILIFLVKLYLLPWKWHPYIYIKCRFLTLWRGTFQWPMKIASNYATFLLRHLTFIH